MKNENFDQKIKDRLQEETNYHPSLKEDIWSKIDEELEKEEKKVVTIPERSRKKEKKNGWKKITTIASIAASLLIVLTLATTETGSAFISHVKDLFVPEKVVVDELEGMEEESNVSLQEGKSGYVIYFDKEMYSMIQVEGKDRIIFNQELSDMYPEVYMEIDQLNESPEQLAEKTHQQLKLEYPNVLDIESVKAPIESIVVHAVGGTGGLEWNDPVVRYYFFSNEKGGSFVVKQQYFIEASEGHGARFDHMLKEFYIVENE